MTNPAKLKDERRGGANRGQGRHLIAETVARRVNVSIDDATAERLRAYGDGNLSEGIRRAAALTPLDPPSKSPGKP